MFKQITTELGYFDLPGKVIVYRQSNEAVLVDAGLDSRTGRKVQRELERMGVQPKVLIITNAHADHFGGASELKQTYPELQILASPLDRPVIEVPAYEPFYLYGAQPLSELQNKFLQAEPVQVDQLLIPDSKVTLLDEDWEVLDLHGHTPGQIGLVPPGGEIVLTADAFFPVETIAKYRLPYHFDVEGAVQTLQKLEQLSFGEGKQLLVPGHGEPCIEVQQVVMSNLQAIHETMELVQQRIAKMPHTREEVVAYVMQEYQIQETVSQYFLTLSSISTYLSYLQKEKLVEAQVQDGKLIFSA